ncbi:hypothetical protein IQ255_01090 [Pleurocapsales cyanobacterium LEGE 10410]|nr:hypothetical protein [Pleurocapsales cyanobacterium LEGE 10410]
MESAENQEQPIKASQSEKPSNSSSLSKTETVKLLNDSVERLKQTIEKINDNSASTLPPADSINALSTTTQKLVDTVTLTVPEPVSVSQPASKVPVPVPTDKQQSPTVKTPIQASQPVAKVQKKKNLVLIVIGVTAIAIAIVAVFWLWLPQYQDTTRSSISEPSVTEVVIDSNNGDRATLETPTIAPDSPGDIADNTAVEQPAVLEPANTALEPSATIPIPQDLESIGKAKNLKIATIKPELSFTPEQTLIAALQTKLTELTKNYAESINFIKVDISTNSLMLEVTDDWYELSETRQNKLANEMLERSRKLDFSDLKLQDSTGKLVARNPVIGDKIIILQSDRL